jgi:hypothetical protein
MSRPSALVARAVPRSLRDAAFLAAAALVVVAAGPSRGAGLTPQEAKQIGVDAYIYSYVANIK